jgi:uncharacterized membrane protein
MSASFSIKESFEFGWKTFKARPWIFVKAGLAVALIGAVFNLVSSGLGELGKITGGPLFILIAILSLAVSLASIYVSLTVNNMGTISFYLKAHDDVSSVTLRDLYRPHPFWRFLLSVLMVTVIVIIGFILLIIPGIIAVLALSFTTYLVLTRDIKAADAIKESLRLTNGNRWKLFLFILASLLVNIVGFIALFIGLFVTIPVSLLAYVHVFRTIEAAKEGLTAPAA